jgi:hypothetical protein
LEVVLPSELKEIGNEVFFGCSNLKSIVIPSKVERLGSSVFKGCLSLSSIALPNSLVHIENSTFFGCSGLRHISLPSNLQSLGTTVFAYSGLRELSLPDNVSSLSSEALAYSANLSILSIGIKCNVSKDVFEGCESLKSIHLRGKKYDPSLCNALNYSGFPHRKDVSIYDDYEFKEVCGRSPIPFPTETHSPSGSGKLEGWQISLICFGVVLLCLVIALMVYAIRLRRNDPANVLASTPLITNAIEGE